MAWEYKKVVAWQRAHKLTLAVYEHTKRFPHDERYGLTSQLRRSASSVPANIAEGSGRETGKDYLRFLIISRASLKETEYFLLLGLDLKYLTQDEYSRLTELVNDTMRPLSGLIKAVQKDTGVLGRFQASLIATMVITLGKYCTPFS